MNDYVLSLLPSQSEHPVFSDYVNVLAEGSQKRCLLMTEARVCILGEQMEVLHDYSLN